MPGEPRDLGMTRKERAAGAHVRVALGRGGVGRRRVAHAIMVVACTGVDMCRKS
jgi:hypothetical protein